MLKPTRTEIEAQASNLASGGLLEAEDQKDARALVRQLADYSVLSYPDLETKLAEVADYVAQQILAALARVEALDQDMDTLQIQGLLTSKEDNDRVGWAQFIRSVLFDGVEVPETVSVGAVTSSTSSSWCFRCGWHVSTCGCGGWC